MKYRSIDQEKIFCCYCGRQIIYPFKLTSEHLVPISKGGNNSYHNKRNCCNNCNCLRGNKSLEYFKNELLAYVKENKIIPPYYKTHDFKIMIENIEYIQIYIESAGNKLLKSSLLGEHQKVENFRQPPIL